MTLQILGPQPGSSDMCEAILRALPDWFGIEEAIVQYGRDVMTIPTFSAHADGEIVGLLAVNEHFPHAAEIHVMGVLAEHQGKGVGRKLTVAAENWLRERGFRFLQVKTLSPARESAAYEKTRGFYLAMGFVPLQEFPTLWGERNPCLMMIKGLED